jgi:hypothetical protein
MLMLLSINKTLVISNEITALVKPQLIYLPLFNLPLFQSF